MKKLLISIAVLTLLVSFNAVSQEKPLKIGFVNVETIITEMPSAKKADEDIRNLGKKYQDTLIQMQTDFQTKLEAYQKQQSMMSAEKKEEEEMSLQAMQQTFLQYREEKFGQQGELALLREQVLEPIRNEVKVAIDVIAKEEKFNIILDAAGPSVWYFEDKYDVTFKVLDRIKRGTE